ncbi:MAG TPA: carbamoyltransferase HypF [Methanocorpusculum sp.]|nr:carbamoyltransferase HypF [Methanocorpusculum sp.]
MRCGRIIVRGIVQGVGFRPFVYATAIRRGIRGYVINHGSEVEINACGDQFDEFIQEIASGPKMAVVDTIKVEPLPEGIVIDNGFSILPSAEGEHSGFIPADIATCEDCLVDIVSPTSRYYGYWATSCTNCGPRYSIIHAVPYDRERTAMNQFPPCANCTAEYKDPQNRRHHAQTIACCDCGPKLSLQSSKGINIATENPIQTTAELLDKGHIIAIRGVGGYHICCVEEEAGRLKKLLGRPHQPLAVMMQLESLKEYVIPPLGTELEMMKGSIHPIMILDKVDPTAHTELSELHNLGVMLPYTGLHHLLFMHLKHPLLVMTSANAPGNPMITETTYICEEMGDVAEYILSHNRDIVNRCDDSVMRDGYIIRLSRGLAPLRTAMDLGNKQILGVGPELNANASIYKNGFVVTSPHIGNIRNPQTVTYLEETIAKLCSLMDAKPEIIAHDLHPQFLSTRLARTLAEEMGAVLCPVQHHCAHIASITTEEVVGIAIDGVGYGMDSTIWGGEILAGSPANGYVRTGHLEQVLMPGGDLATKFPERMLYGILPDETTLSMLEERNWDAESIQILVQTVAKNFNCPSTTSTGRVLDAAAALLGICQERTYDGEPSMVLEAYAARGKSQPIDVQIISKNDRTDILMTSEILRDVRTKINHGMKIVDAAATIQTSLAKGIAELAIRAVERTGIQKTALSGGVAINRSIRRTILLELAKADIPCITNHQYPLGDGSISYGQVITAGILSKEGIL